MKRLINSIIMLLIICIPVHTSAFDNDITHPHITGAALRVSKIYVYLHDNFDFAAIEDENENIIDTTFDGESVSALIKDGSMLEDKPACRASNHFHNPLKEWRESGLTDTWWLVNAYCSLGDYPAGEISSNITWGTGYKTLTSRETNVLDANEWDWESARGYFYAYLTGKDYKTDTLIARDQDSRNLYMKDCFRAVGQVMHLLQDNAVPAHTRNDFSQGHTRIRWSSSAWPAIGNPFELYVKEHDSDDVLWFNTAIRSNFSDPFLTQFWDTDRLSSSYAGGDMTALGLAEYTNLNFLSAFTLFTEDLPSTDPHYFPFPNAGDCAITFQLSPEGIPDLNRQYISSSNGHPGEQVDRLAVVGQAMHYREKYFSNISSENLPVFLNDDCYEEYAEKLIPHAIGYSADLLDYFFRGEIDARNVVLQIDSTGKITSMTMEIKNNSTLGQTTEPFVNGAVELSYHYTLNDISISGGEDLYIINDETDTINTDYVSKTVTFSDPIALGAQDLSFALVYKGTLGNEHGAVAACILQPTSEIAYSYQPGGTGNISNIYINRMDGSSETQLTYSDTYGLWYWFPAWSPDGRLMAFNKETCSESNPVDDTCLEEYYNVEISIIDRMSSEVYPNNEIQSLVFNDPYWSGGFQILKAFSFSPDGNKIVAIVSVSDLYTGLVVFDVATATWNYMNSLDYWRHQNLNISAPEWSPNGDKIVYSSDLDDPGNEFTPDIFLINPTGDGTERLTNDEYKNTHPSWSLNGAKILFVSDRDGQGIMDIWIMDRDGLNKEKILDCDSDCYYPGVSADGKTIVFQTNGEIYSVPASSRNLDSTDMSQITNTGAQKIAPACSPLLIENTEQ